jgi:hypothetical protein
MTKLTKEQAQAIIEALDINLEDGEESQLLLENNSELFYAYMALLAIATGD